MDSEASSSSQRLRYRPLDPSRHEIRVLSIDSSSQSSGLLSPRPLRLTLEHVSLNDFSPAYLKFRSNHPLRYARSQVDDDWHEKPDLDSTSADLGVHHAASRFTWGDYTALSYTWGCLEETDTIIVNGMSITVGTNLAAALAHLHDLDSYKIWVDALCINMDDIDERNAHVLRIRKIFQDSFAVRIWLGKDEMRGTGLTSRVEEAFDIFHRCGFYEARGTQTLKAALGLDVKQWKDSDQYDDGFEIFSDDTLYFDAAHTDDSDFDNEFEPPHFRDLVSLALNRLFENRYWSRLWIIQELATSPDSSTLHWGDSAIPLQTILTLAIIFCDKILDAGLLNPSLENAISPGLQLLKVISDWQESAVLLDEKNGLKGKALEDLLLLVESAKCALPQDRVYGLLGLLPMSIGSKIAIDYSRDEPGLFSEFETTIRYRQVRDRSPEERWTREMLENAFNQARSSPSAVFLDSFGRRVFQYEGKVIKYGEPVDIQEAQVLSFIGNSGLGIPVPQVYSSGMCENMGVIEMEMIKGDTLQNIWPGLLEGEKHSYAMQLRQIVNRLRSLEGDYIGSINKCPAIDARRDRNRGGPFFCEAEFNEFLLSNTISTTPTIYRKMLKDLLSTKTHKILFTHGDLSPTNIIVNNGCIVSIIDWEYAGWYPEHWEFVQFFRALYADYRDYAEVIFEKLYPTEFMIDNFLGHLTRH